MCVGVCVRRSVCTSECVYVGCVHVCVRVRVCVEVYTCVRVRVCT